MDSQEVIAQCRAIRVARGITRAAVAERMGCSSSFIQSIEYRTGVDRRWGTVMAYAEAVGVEVRVQVIEPSAPEIEQ